MTTTHDPQRPYGPRTTGRRRALIAAALIAAGVLALACANPGADDDLTTEQDKTNRAAVSASATTTATTAPAPTTTTATTQPTTAAPTKSTIPPIVLTDGTYTIGEDAPAGRYKVAERAGDLCYWSRTRGEDDIIDNGIGGGYPSFTAKQGETVEISSCPEFRRMGGK